jgi:hypothetical protein
MVEYALLLFAVLLASAISIKTIGPQIVIGGQQAVIALVGNGGMTGGGGGAVTGGDVTGSSGVSSGSGGSYASSASGGSSASSGSGGAGGALASSESSSTGSSSAGGGATGSWGSDNNSNGGGSASSSSSSSAMPFVGGGGQFGGGGASGSWASSGTPGATGGGVVLGGSGAVASNDTSQLGRGADGKFGDGESGLKGAVVDAYDLATESTPSEIAGRGATLAAINSGAYTPDPESRLGAYAATRGYPKGSTGYAVHNAIGTIYGALGTYGEEKIGRVFNSAQAKALYSQPVTSSASLKIATIEYGYWANVKAEDPLSAGGQLGTAFSPSARDALQKKIFSL